jgi:hypothetical protein
MPLTYAGQRVTAELLSEDYSNADTNSTTVTAASATALGAAYSIPASDPAVNTVYRLVAFGTGTWGSTQQQLNLMSYLAGAQVNSAGFAAATFATSQAFDWEAEWILIISVIGSSGTCNCKLKAAVTATSASSADQGDQTLRVSSGSAIDTVVANTIQIYASWASTTGAPTLTCDGGYFEKLGG